MITVNGVLLNEFDLGYVICAMQTTLNPMNLNVYLHEDNCLYDMDVSLLRRMVGDSQSFQEGAIEWLGEAYASDTAEPCQAGVDFWVTREGKGGDFVDQKYRYGKELNEMAKKYGKGSKDFDQYTWKDAADPDGLGPDHPGDAGVPSLRDKFPLM